MAIDFEFYENPDPSGENAGKYHARVVTYRTVKTPEIARNIQKASSLTIGDVMGVLSALSDELSSNLEDSNRVHLEGIGYFQATVQVAREVDVKKTRANSVFFKSVTFRADKVLKKKLITAITQRSMIKSHSAKLSDEKVDRLVSDYLQEKKAITRRNLQLLCGFTEYTATKHIRRMLEEGKIKNINTSKQPVYVQG